MKKYPIPQLDLPLLLAVLMLMLLSSMTVWSASGFSETVITNHLIRCMIALCCLLAMSAVPSHVYLRFSPHLYLLTVILLLAVALVGDSTNGSQRWLKLGFIRFQPSELVKIAIPMIIAWLIHTSGQALDLRKILYALLLAAIPTMLIFIQPDLDGAGSSTAKVQCATGIYLVSMSTVTLNSDRATTSPRYM